MTVFCSSTTVAAARGQWRSHGTVLHPRFHRPARRGSNACNALPDRRSPASAIADIMSSECEKRSKGTDEVHEDKPDQQQEEALQDNPKASQRERLRWMALIALVLQNSTLALCMRHSRTNTPPEDRYISSTAVIMSEAVKTITAFGLVYHDAGNLAGASEQLRHAFCVESSTTLKLMIPSLLYTLQNNLQYIAISNLHAAIFQVLYQMKLLTTALLSVAMLGKKLTKVQWISLLILVFGISMVQLSQDKSGTASTESNVVGLIAVSVSCCTSAFAGVYFEKVLKTTASSIWVRNVQLGLFGVVIGLCGCYMNDRQMVSEKGFFHGYNSMVWFVICVQAIGGLIVAAVVKYADNVLKGLATSLSILLSALVSTVVFDFGLSTMFLVGAVAVISAVFLYGMPTDKMQGVGPFSRRLAHLDDSAKKHKDDEAQPIPPA